MTTNINQTAPSSAQGTLLDCVGCCIEKACGPWKELKVCQTWFFLNLVALQPLLPSNIGYWLRMHLPQNSFTYCAVGPVCDVAVYWDVLLKIQPGLGIDVLQKLTQALDSHFEPAMSKIHRLSCCRTKLKVDIPFISARCARATTVPVGNLQLLQLIAEINPTTTRGRVEGNIDKRVALKRGRSRFTIRSRNRKYSGRRL